MRRARELRRTRAHARYTVARARASRARADSARTAAGNTSMLAPSVVHRGVHDHKLAPGVAQRHRVHAQPLAIAAELVREGARAAPSRPLLAWHVIIWSDPLPL